jgi:hypothetical protein
MDDPRWNGDPRSGQDWKSRLEGATVRLANYGAAVKKNREGNHERRKSSF